MNNLDEYKVVSFQNGQTRNGKVMWRLGLQKLGEENVLTGVIWSEDIPRFDGTKFKVGNIIKFLGQDYNSNYNSVVVKNVTVLKEALAGLPKELTKQYLKDLNDYLDIAIITYNPEESTIRPDIANADSIFSIAKIIKALINLPEFSTTPAAEKHHHNYIGGLLKHTHEVYEILCKLTKMFPIEKANELILAGILHDIGKCYEYTTSLKLGTASINEDWIYKEFSHILFGVRLAQDAEAYDIARMVASHHGKIEWGALFEPKTPEEKVLHLADMLSATTGITTIDKLEQLVKTSLINVDVAEEKESTKEEIKNARKNDSNIL